MSKIKDLKTNPENQINIIDMISLIVPDGKSKYVETLLRIMKNTSNISDYVHKIREELSVNYGLSKDTLKNISDWQIIYYYRFFDSMFNQSDLKSFKKFCEFNERGLIEENDLTKYNNFEYIVNQLSIAELKSDMKELESQIKRVYEDDTWLVVRPLTYHASKKYGANTKWCTTATNEYSYFRKYATNGILLYMINKVDGTKVACYKCILKYDIEFSFWNQVDSRIDSIESGLPIEVLKAIKDEVKSNPVSNRSYLTQEQIIKDDEINGYNDKKSIRSISQIVSDENEETMVGREGVMVENGAPEVYQVDAVASETVAFSGYMNSNSEALQRG